MACTGRWAAPARWCRAWSGCCASAARHVRCNAEVRRILVENGRATGVELADGERLGADIVVSNADTAWTYRHLIERAAPAATGPTSASRARSYSMSLFVWYFGTNRQYPDVPHHMMVLGPRYEGLLKDIFERHHLSRRLQPVPAPPHGHRPGHGAARPRCVLRAGAGAAPGQRHRLGGHGRKLPPAHRTAPARHRAARTGRSTSSRRA